jgi:hypothetical protein
MSTAISGWIVFVVTAAAGHASLPVEQCTAADGVVCTPELQNLVHLKQV